MSNWIPIAHSVYATPFEHYTTFTFHSQPSRSYFFWDREEMQFESARPHSERHTQLFTFFLRMARRESLYPHHVFALADVMALGVLK